MKTKTMLMIATAAMAMLVHPATAREKPLPRWDELTKLLGKKKDSAQFKTFAKKYELKSLGGSKDTDVFASKSTGLFISASADDLISKVGFRKGYSRPLPYKLKWSMNIEQVMKVLGKPSKIRSNSILTYKDKGMIVYFSRKTLFGVFKELPKP